MDSQYWNDRYINGATGWDMGRVSPPLQEYIEQLPNRDLRILVPGGGNSYEATYLAEKAFGDVTVLDIAPVLIQKLQEQFKYTRVKVVEEDFFVHAGQYDLILEQTFFCAIDPALRPDYVAHMHRLLKPEGHLVGVLFNRDFTQEGPPFGGNEAEYRALFDPYFDIKTLAPCYNSHPARQGAELFINFIPKIISTCTDSY
ncbi:TPMT family class I SAM-dependent methyltransferase [Chitinophaga nivalis]|uniref:TPMT family class I SAM-dependent methyltransferase n=1 Tax=Chitinophaga nivalis TaxID=2991709 RepID=A0ABT3ISI7_9BACT|nr:TPMT family class I SAM-dependent methyltransferase [Chitinophaga nivalis]MCW3463368.1 TPMT family class I SAM-dependent methyltransferase [Chitinophaga nivalis]MCW3486942.1 TPMT family class I SAM-dependent methyltransferase [Chitinophaga nivalis]